MGRTMGKVHSVSNGMALLTVITLVLAMFLATTGYAQVRYHNGNLELEEIQASEVTADGLRQSVMQLSGSYEIRQPIGEIYNRTPWPDPLINFFPGSGKSPAGDLNGDGINDVERHYYNQLDPRDNDPGTMADRTLVFYPVHHMSSRICRCAHGQLRCHQSGQRCLPVPHPDRQLHKGQQDDAGEIVSYDHRIIQVIGQLYFMQLSNDAIFLKWFINSPWQI